jgi:putative FmdB family regulatory protein
MPMYDFECLKCEEAYEEFVAYDATGKYKGVKCPHCGSKRKTKLITACQFAFADPVGTDRWNNSHDYRFKHNIPRVKKEREMAEKLSHMGGNPYGNIDDSGLDTGIHDAGGRKGLS